MLTFFPRWAIILPMTGPEAIAIIKALGLSQRQFALLTGAHVNTLSHWAQGRHAPDQVAATLLRLLERRPEDVEVLRELAGVGPGERVKASG